MMGTICHHTVSLDGFIAGPDDSMDGLFGFGKATSLADETMRRVGAILAGRRWYELAIERWNGVDGIYGGAYAGRVFVLTHDPAQDCGDARISFISDPIEVAVAIAQDAAEDKDVAIFGATLSRQCLRLGCLMRSCSTLLQCCLAEASGSSAARTPDGSGSNGPALARPSS
jgi:dihydrofolate reductase